MPDTRNYFLYVQALNMRMPVRSFKTCTSVAELRGASWAKRAGKFVMRKRYVPGTCPAMNPAKET